MRLRLSFGIAIVVVSTGIAVADDYKPPPMKDGLWETRSVQTAGGKSSNDVTLRMCQTKETAQQSQIASDEVRKRNRCTSNIIRRSGNSVEEEVRCAQGPSAGEVTRFMYTHTGDTAFHIELHVKKGDTDTVTVLDSKYLSSCPAGMKPGEVMMPDGTKLGGK